MKFKHAYVVGGAEGQKVELLDPHGKSSGEDKHFYTKELVDKIQDLYKQIDQLTEELEGANHQTFSLESRGGLNSTFTQLGDYIEDSSIKVLKGKWERLLKRKELREEGYNFTGLSSRAGISFLEQIKKNISILKQSDLGKGFWEDDKKLIAGKQEINYSTLTEYFHSIRINKLGK